jgi:hypothetical protein
MENGIIVHIENTAPLLNETSPGHVGHDRDGVYVRFASWEFA